MLVGALPTILIVDDSPENLTVLSELLQLNYRVRAATSGEKALRIATTPPWPDLILLDVMMPGMDGYEVFTRLRREPLTREIPVIFVTAMDSADAELRGLDVGAVDYIAKPIVPPILLARVRTQLELKQARDWLKNQNAYLETELARRMQENLVVQDVSIHALAHLAEIRDPETGNHLRRTQRYVRALAQQLQRHTQFADFLTDRVIDQLTKSAPLHDIGKVGIPDSILLKPGKLTPAEWEVMKTHAKLGSDAIEQAERDADRVVEFLVLAKDIAHYHHEKWDGSGYPEGRSGSDIPIAARLMALADVFDALISPRVYKPPMPFADALEIIVAGRGKHFDPDVVDAFLTVFEEFRSIAERYAEPLAE
ncbi:response regulator [Chromatium okenii]|jgi:putative two-component system response regulator|uniref:Two-component system response regulator n=1 Tax=Chromatium okenii TaxID=61644 RepID=A0A2S7XPB4_9GAMM|nr:two-component system response regulator [Chromatium okenii]MBV5310189.1 two-component system response regulator [Chromatium okenii]PQJ95580.1 two-component system response regulator [Chromatium okenii]PQJ97624.1 two-component system response regulator [Chromatium okenii]